MSKVPSEGEKESVQVAGLKRNDNRKKNSELSYNATTNLQGESIKKANIKRKRTGRAMEGPGYVHGGKRGGTKLKQKFKNYSPLQNQRKEKKRSVPH